MFLEFPYSLEVDVYLQGPLMYYYRDLPVDQYRLVDTILGIGSPDQQQKHPCQSNYISCI